MRQSILVTITVILVYSVAFAFQATPELSELQKLKAENHKLKIQVTQCQVNLIDEQAKSVSTQLSNEQLLLENEFREKLKPSKDGKFNWNTLSFDEPKANEKAPIIK